VPTRPAAWDLFSGGDFYEPLSRYAPNENDFIRLAMQTLGPEWRFARNDLWFHCTHPTAPLAPQGWKIHISATTSNAQDVLRRTMPVLMDVGVSFKCAADIRLLSTLNSKTSFRGGSGKFMTIYPFDEAQFKLLLSRLHEVTHDLEGPYILSDRRYDQSKVLFYRYGGFWPRKRLDPDGVARPIIMDPQGNPVFDKRTPHYVKPDWVEEPFPPTAASADGQESRTLGNGRYYIDGVLSFSNSGGVYLATDRHHEGRRVVIKEARPLVSRISETDDAVAILKKEARLLAKVGDLGVSPQLYDVFQDWEHWYIVQEYVEARTLWSLGVGELAVLLNTRPTGDDYAAFYDLFGWIFIAVCEAVSAIHARGIVLADLSPHNVLVQQHQRRVRIIDYEGAFEPGVDTPTNLATPGFVSPQRGNRTAVPTFQDDYFALGAMMLSFIFRITVFLQLDPAATTRVVRQLCRDARIPAEVAALIEATLDSEPARRPSPATIAVTLRGTPAPAAPTLAGAEALPDLGEAIRRTAAYITAHATPEAEHRLFPCDFRIYRTNPVGLAYGSAGVLSALAYVDLPVPDAYVEWTLERAGRIDALPAGFALGRSGIAWALLDLGRTDDALAMLANARRDPSKTDWATLFYGLTGYGLTELAFFLALGDEHHLVLAQEAADAVLARAHVDPAGNLYWEHNGTSIGLAHGASGVALLLLYMHLVTGDSRYLEQGRRALAFDVSHGVVMRDGGIEWPYTPSDRTIVSPYWDFGTAGIGSVALRYRHLAGITDFDDTLERVRVSTDRAYTLVPGKQFGLAGIGGYSLDAYRFTGEERYLAAARRTCAGIMLYAVEREQGMGFPGTEQNKLSCDFAVGSAGVMTFFHRLATGKAAEFMLDEHFTAAGEQLLRAV
jgi:tRNA A-37 threonylcarbamoyl transferase component Bud32